jgi:hypothetical protein
MFRSVVTEVMDVRAILGCPASDVNPLRRTEETGGPDVLLTCPAGGPMKVFIIFGKLARSPVRQNEEEGDTQKAAGEDDHLAFK